MSSESGLELAMRSAIAVSEGVRGFTSPNPPVGCMIVDAAGKPVGFGGTSPPGQAHAEVVALRMAGTAARGGTAFVTLEPCAHHGRTPPCVDALLDAGIAQVYYAVDDPFPAASGGARRLRDAGVTVHSGLLADQVRTGPLRAWLHHVRTGRPHVTWKFASTVDGRTAAEDGTSRWISSPEARAEVHELRLKVDAVIVGIGTVLVDDPQLIARPPANESATRQPLRVVVGERDIPPGSRVLDDAAETVHLRTRDPMEVMDALTARGVVDVLLEGGPRLAGAFWESGLVDRALVYMAPMLLGAGTPVLGGIGVGTIGDALPLAFESATMIGPDVRISAVPAPE
ncbi:bifunctional diaminohydroxyphosphoribosylaminopyrimidine deaminase/5-amino-6-(5-phosphoribosylamino)uracil reductase RibD [Allokutzneria sp. A3M-2-11 16]|uniref:bifunctional diaminohydroxyphosphoribosylaminopyrimidine deaminase/5-amino-6-(5-phosphoribosylamino)uracil reductase RibD n=1 Tax=Allokutzneria sp. A3M-2-11 16 TaxID=2962043 RepID=UPI0020B6F785|nr:bifunctional diaminohydroxyphosphoribosylaminopyrimidine deaminase/5-amino-6-(5-phosphoribosylamino)uracil reductase RibD [Allokutzneria sp. A3M-2-11 16]MCP3801202.1 bifunctional diaminohydroxyphosphoribosylaminopyrimidine deaminase/5-amino-6-(5-phosphoribosylamino)uracil reductase RibD [Allokutzneria sp. A3M-2-11 16]